MTAPSVYSKFETELRIRPDDIDMNNHVHNSHYLDYVLAARYDQMTRCYKMSMDEFVARGFAWVVKSCHIEYKRALVLSDTIIVRTWVDRMEKTGVVVRFEIVKKESGKLASDGVFEYTMISSSSGRPAEIPEDVIQKYSV
ncbi:MAG TPA: acyl-CoA thioesterase [Bacteroidota bacterium]|nr:acyl-CoA thioesterase [Bacteroidota bacterium]